MADISKIKLPDGTTYNIKDATARGYVTGVKGNSESSYRTGNVNITAANVGAIPSNSSGNTQNLARPLKLNGLNDNTLDSKINTLRANRLAFLPADQIIIEKTTDGGTTWVDAGISDAAKTGLFSETRPVVSLPLLNGVKSLLCGIRITFTAMKYNVPSGTAETAKYNYWNSNYIASTERYNQLKEMYFWVSTNSDTMGIKVQRATGAASTNWLTIFDDSSFLMTGWSGCDYLRFSQGVFGGGTNQTSNYWNYRITLMTKGTTASGGTTLATTYTTSAQSVMEIRGYGDTWWTAGTEYAANDKIYTHDYLKNVTFPAKVTATDFVGKIDGADFYNKNNSGQNANNINSNGIGYYTSNGPSTSLGASTNDGAIITQRYSDAWQGQIAQDYRNGGLFVRGKNNGTWQSWQKVYDSAHKPSLASDITGTLPIANGGTGKTNGKDAANYFMNALDTGSSTPVDADYYISQYVGGGTTTTTYHRRPVSALWEYIKGKISSILGLTATNYGGTSAKATADASGNTITSYYAPKSTAVTNVALATNKITKTINGSTTDVVTAATTSAYGITKLNTATNSTSTTEAATPSAVKIAKDRADEAYTKAAMVESGLNGTLIYDHSYTILNGVATFTPHVYLKGEEVTSNYAKSCFVWKYKLANDVTGTPSYIPLTTNNDRTCTVTISVLGYGGYVLGEFTPPSS